MTAYRQRYSDLINVEGSVSQLHQSRQIVEGSYSNGPM